MLQEKKDFEFGEKFEIEPSVQWIKDNNFKRVSLQFPEELYPESTKILLELEKSIEDVDFAIIAEKKHTSCCLDELGASHFHADCILHFGDSCLTPPLHLPTRFVFDKGPINLDSFNCHMKELSSKYEDKRVILFYHLSYHHLKDVMMNMCEKHFKSFICPQLIIPQMPSAYLSNKGNNNNVIVKNNNSSIKNNSCFNENKKVGCCVGESSSSSCCIGVAGSSSCCIGVVGSSSCCKTMEVGGSSCSCCMKIEEGSGSNNEGKCVNNLGIHTEKDKNNINISNNNNKVEDKINQSEVSNENNNSRIFIGRRINFEVSENDVILYVSDNNDEVKKNGVDSMDTSLLLVFNKSALVVYDGSRGVLKTETTSHRLLMKRHYLVEKARDSRFVAILMQTFDTPYYLEVTNLLKMAAKLAGKKARVYSPGVINCAKLANMADFELYVVVSCVRSSLPDHSDYMQPIITPFEFLTACSSSVTLSVKSSLSESLSQQIGSLSQSSEDSGLWSDHYSLDFKELLDMTFHPIKNDNDVSLLTGKMRKLGGEDEDDGVENDLRLSKVSNTVATISADRLEQRSWKGLELNLGRDPVPEVIQGLIGTASGYKHENKS